MDFLPCPNVDIVCEAESLPFRSASIDLVESGAVFEHLHDPWAATAEVKRVLKPGGIFLIDTAFMQGYHGFPGHYNNMTPQAVETHLEIKEADLRGIRDEWIGLYLADSL